jgi:hypothetical protein
MNDTDTLSLRDTAKGVAVRAGILSAGALIVGAWLFGLAAKAASGLVKFFVGAILLSAAAGVATWQVKKVQRHIGGTAAL